jgi:hypothetical protein
MVDDSQKFSSLRVFLIMARHLAKPWLKPKYLCCGHWLDNLNMAKVGLSSSVFPLLRHEPMTIMQGQTCTCRIIAHKLAGQTSIGVSSHIITE